MKRYNNKIKMKMLLNLEKMLELNKISVVKINFVKEMDNVFKLKMDLRDVNVIKDLFLLFVLLQKKMK